MSMDLKVFQLNENRYLEPATASILPASHGDGENIHWFDINQPAAAALTEFLSPLQLHPLILEGCLDIETASRIAPYGQALFIKLPVQLAWDSPNHLFLSIICLPASIITIHESAIPALDDIENEFSSAVRFRNLSTSAILYQILDHLIDEDMAFALEVRRTIESLEEAIDLDPESVQIEQILVVKRLVSRLSMTFEDQWHCVAALQTAESEVFDIQDFREYFRDSLSHLEYVLRSAGRQQARLTEIHQHYLLTLQDKTNKRINLIAIISAIFMPLTLITGIYGMNFRSMPELKWDYAYPLVITLMVLIAVVLLFIFQQKGWFR